MTIQDFITGLGQFKWTLLIMFTAIPLAAFLVGLIQGDTGCSQSKIRYVYSVLLYFSCIPGMFAFVLTAYSLLFLGANLLSVNIVVYGLPIISMIATLVIIKRKNSFSDIPGFGRIVGVMLMMGISFGIAFFVSRLFIFIGFVGKITGLLVIAVMVFILLKIAMKKMSK